VLWLSIACAQPALAPVDPSPYGKLVAVTVEQAGTVVLQQRFRDGVTRKKRPPADPSLHDIRSAGKSITALAVGVAIAEGSLSVDTPVWPLLVPNLDPDDPRASITVRQLLTMSSGLDCDDGRPSPGNEERMYRRRSWRTFALQIPLAEPPSTGGFTYCTAGVFLLGQVVEHVTSTPFDAFVQQHLFDPLDIHQVRWHRSRSGEVQSGGQLQIGPAALAKLGRLVLDGGAWNGNQLVPRDWLKEMLAMRPLNPEQGYGYLWWFRTFRTPEGPTPGAYMSGNGGNVVVLLPAFDAVVVVQSANYNQPGAHQRSTQLVESIVAGLERP
jgi:CubicO group peptidase (beta-lactamase class C family)